ncbi:hypothetical protein [Ruminococcus sp. FC2018]|uniref:hypothetical protein n=1 Tax=Ruminococcus sp. FC2018 TaxID=1410617 RepID=UPI000AC5135C|nr:hypothetical protein [Ruminococcus sp. FC2018]
MDDLMAKLQSVLNDEQSMKQLSQLAGALSGDDASQAQPAAGEAVPNDFSQLLKGLDLQPQPQQPAPPSTSGIDVAKLMQLQTILQQANKHDKNVDLLLALRPLLKEENQVKIDRLIKIFKLFSVYPALKQSGLLGGDLFGIL